MTSRWRLKEAARCLQGGGIVAYPTEAIYGLGCDPLNLEAVLRLLRLKQRPPGMGLILIGAHYAQVEPFIGAIERAKLARARRTWPGPFTWLLPASPAVPPWIRGAYATVALRVTAHPVAAALCDAFGGALVSTSANRHGQTPARSALGVRLGFGDDIDLVVSGDTGGLQQPTAIRDAVTGEAVRL
jgi:L-threonylcarbamoyladenylate synthase